MWPYSVCFSSLSISDDPPVKFVKSSNPPGAKEPCRHVGCNKQAKKRYMLLMKILMLMR